MTAMHSWKKWVKYINVHVATVCVEAIMSHDMYVDERRLNIFNLFSESSKIGVLQNLDKCSPGYGLLALPLYPTLQNSQGTVLFSNSINFCPVLIAQKQNPKS